MGRANEMISEAFIEIFVGWGMTESQAEDATFVLALLMLFAIFRYTRSRKKMGKAWKIDTDRDGQISEEEWAAAGMPNEDKEEE